MGKYDQAKKDVLACTQWLSEHGYFGALRGTGGNVSMRIAGKQAVAVTPSTLPYRELSFTDICIVDFELQPIEGDLPPSVETGMHIAVYRSRLDVNAVVHTHQVKASVLSLIDTHLPALYDEVALHIGPEVAVVPYALSGTPELIANVTAKLANNCHGYILQNHGALNLGETLEKAWLNVELLEKTAETYLAALSTGREITPLPTDIVDLLVILRKDAQDKAIAKNHELLET